MIVHVSRLLRDATHSLSLSFTFDLTCTTFVKNKEMLSSKDTLRTGTTDCFDDRVFERCVRKHVVIAEYLFSILLCKAIGKDNTFNTIKSPVILNLYSKRVGGKMLLLEISMYL